ncbi:putative membrane protein [Spinactinospora alkalitolerans]|uniref:Putative membrane protein n=1 Tax=Spinactinospora alkalitolerans TaxID=687207 RepID=A0A852TXT6_9ACTN|nr:cytochrome c oxidase assembly protein [Spinactinospora alkalitolerans]NYE47633.1 putative membrane protein [Spinactinospora alkalitolerans]
MSPAHHGGAVVGWLPVLVLLAAALVVYAGAARRARRAPRGWSGLRTASFAAGVVLLAAALSPAVVQGAHHDPRGHMLQHLVIGMYAPLALVLAAPVTLALRTMAPAWRRRAARLLRSRALHVLGHPVTALLLDIGGLYLVHLTPVYAAMQASPAVHALVNLHYFAAGYLFAWAVAGPDPAPRRPGTPTRLAVLFAAVAAHSLLAKLLYAYPGTWPPGADHAAAMGEAAKLMYYGGDLAEVLLAVALFAAWYRRRGRRFAARRPVPAAGGP